MSSINNKISVCLALFLFSLGTSFAIAQEMRAVVLTSQGDRVTINKGTSSGVKVGQTWVLGQSEVTGAVLIEEARESSATGRLSGDAAIGTLASLGTEAQVANLLSEQRAQEQMVAAPTRSSQATEALRKKYKSAVNSNTESRGFVTKLQGNSGQMKTMQAMQTGVGAYNAYRMYDLTRQYNLDPTGGFSPWWIAASAVNMASQQMTVNKMNNAQRVRVDAEVTYWDADLVDLQTEVMAADKGLSLAETLEQKVLMQSKRGVDKYTVFEVRLENVGKLPAAIGDFKYHMFLMSAEGRPISASRVDPVLDRTLAPGDEVRGMIYFPRIVAVGQGKLKVAFENMFGDRGDMTFRTR